MAGSTQSDKTTIFDEEITALEKRRSEVESERQKLLAGQITVTGPDGSTKTNINLGVLSSVTADQRTVDRHLRQTLLENPLVPVLDNSFKKTRELREELAGTGGIAAANSASPFGRLIRANSHSNRVVSGKNAGFGKFFASPWLIVIGLVILLIWCGGPLLFAVSGGKVGGKNPSTSVPSATPTKAITAVPPTTKAVSMEEADTLNLVSRVNFIANPLKFEPAPTPEAQVGGQPNNAGGFNGPHGSFMAPSRMTVAAIGLDTPVERAITQNNPNGGVSIVSWPRPGEVVQTGAYPGETGNMMIMGNQADLGTLRRIQQNDEVTVYDRKGNAFVYRMLAFSADGQTEREVNPTAIDDAWVFGSSDDAILTILVTYPQPLPAVDPNQTGNNQVTPRDDYLVQTKLAYRGILAMYAPATVKPIGTPVMVPVSAWQTVAASSQQSGATSNIAATPTPSTEATVNQNPSASPAPTTPSIPSGLPDTGGGGLKPSVKAGRFSSQ